MASVKVRAAAAEDIERMLDMQAASPGASRWNAAAYHDFLAAADGSSGGLLALDGDRLVGFLMFRRPVPDEMEILNMVVDPAFRRRGVGAELVRQLLAEHRGYAFVELRSRNSVAEAFYGRLGFEEAGRRTDYYRDPPDDAVMMVLGP